MKESLIYTFGKSGYLLWFFVLIVSSVLMYAIFPCVFACLRNKPITSTKYRITCYAVNVFGIVIYYILTKDFNFHSYILWTLIFSELGIKDLRKKDIIADSE